MYRANRSDSGFIWKVLSVATDSLSVTDNRTGKTYELPISEGTIKAIDLRQIKTSEDDAF